MTPHPSKEGREPLTRERIVETATEIIDEVGVQRFSLRQLADALGIETMSLYHHFPNKDAILDGVVERIVSQTTIEPMPADADWKTWMLAGPASARRALEAHPKAGWLFFGRRYSTGPGLQMLESPLAILYAAGFRGQALVNAAHAIFAYIAGWYILASGEGGSWSGPDDESFAAAPEAAPIAMSFAAELRDWGQGFDEGLRALLDGLEAGLGAS